MNGSVPDRTDDPRFPRSLSERERGWCAFLLPDDRPAYRELREALSDLVVLGEGRWGAGDLVLGPDGMAIDLSAPMEPVAAYGEITLDGPHVLSISIHEPDDDGRIEMHFAGVDAGAYEALDERGRWSYSRWRPGEASPASGAAVREIVVDTAGELTLVVDASRHVIWLHDATSGANRLIPVTNFYNELMLLKGVRDPAIGLDHRRLFTAPDESADAELRGAFARYNAGWRKVDAARLAVDEAARPATGFVARIARALRGGAAR